MADIGAGLIALGLAGLLLLARGKNNLEPDPNATGDHTTCKRDPKTGKVTGYAEWETRLQNPSGFQEKKRYDGKGGEHYNKSTGKDTPTPHVHDENAPGG